MSHRSFDACQEMWSIARSNRRELLTASATSLLGVSLGPWLRPLPAGEVRDASFGRAKACIFLFAWGGPSQLDTFDMKPDAPAEIRSTFEMTSTRTPGLQICEHFTRLAQWTDRLAIIRSLTHNDPAHLSSAHATVTGHWAPVVRSDATPPSDRDTPHLGSLLARVRETGNDLPASVMMPWKAYHPAAPGGEAPGQHGGWLGSAYDPLLLTGDPAKPDWKPPAITLRDDVTAERLQSRYAMMKLLDQQRFGIEQSAAVGKWAHHQQRVLEMLCSPRISRAFDLSQEPEAVRERYGQNTHGQCVLLARRLVEHGVPFVTVNWHNDRKNFWDTHVDNFNRLKNDLIPVADQALTALLEDLESRGMLEETIVAWVGEFGRRPRITKDNAGREHWPRCYSGLLAGGGIQGGAVYGSSDRHAAFPETDPVSPQDYAATVLHTLGIDGQQMLHDREGRPHRICEGKPIKALL